MTKMTIDSDLILNAFLDMLADRVVAKISDQQNVMFEKWEQQIFQEKNTTPEIVVPHEKIFGLRAISKYIGCSIQTVQKMIDRNVFPTYLIGNRTLAYTDEIDKGIKFCGEM